MGNNIELLKNGGRVKSSSLAYNSIEPSLTEGFQQRIKDLVSGKNSDLNLSFFPKVGNDMRGSLARQPLRPFISTHQGMPGNFFPFIVEDVDTILKGEFKNSHFESILEPRYSDKVDSLLEMDFKEAMYNGDLKNAFGLLKGIKLDRSSTKGRMPFFVCRPSSTKEMLKIPEHVSSEVESKVNEFLDYLLYYASKLEHDYKNGISILGTRFFNGYNGSIENNPDFLKSLLYFQADTHINLNGDVSVESLHLPDVGFFLKDLSDRGSLKDIKGINGGLREKVIQNIIDTGFDKVTIITRPEVLTDSEDLLEIKEIDTISDDLKENNIKVKIEDVSNIDFDKNQLYILMNIDYNNLDSRKLFDLAIKYPENFSPNPFMQYVSKYISGFNTFRIKGQKQISKLKQVIPGNNIKDFDKTIETMERYFDSIGLDQRKRIINIRKKSSDELLYVSRDSLYSLRKIKEFIKGEDEIEIIEIPFVDGNEIISKNNNDLLHFYRFMFLGNR